MKKIIPYIIFLFTTLAFSQKEASVWYFGLNAGLKFNDNGTTTSLGGGKVGTFEGCSSIADADGNLLFYTDGVTVWDKNHNIMNNGADLLGDTSTTQSAVVIPKPKSSSVYYLFTAPAYGKGGLAYSEIDMTLNNGLGGVTSNKNIPLVSPACEKLTAVKNESNGGYWVVAHGYKDNSFLTYSVSTTGVNTAAVISNIGDNATAQGYLKFSPDGKKLVSCGFNDGTLNDGYDKKTVLFDFDVLTGKVSNPIPLSGTGDLMCYAAEFSPSGNILYLTDTKTFYQLDLTAPDIPKSKTVLYKTNSLADPAIMGLQLGPDGKIYGTVVLENYLCAVNNPDALGSDCNFTLKAVLLTGKGIWGLPQFIQSYFNLSIDAKEGCFGSAISFSLNVNQNITSATWDFGDGSPTSNAINPTHQYAKVGNYKVTVTATSSTGKIVSQTKNIVITTVPVANNVSNQSVCWTAANMQYDLTQFNSTLLGSQSTTVFGVEYFTSLADANNQQNVLPSKYNLPIGSTIIYAKVYSLANPICFTTTSFTVNSFQVPVANTPNAFFVCDDTTNDGKAIFDLQSKTAKVLGIQDTNQYTVSYHFSQTDANTNSNPLALNYPNSGNPQLIYVRVTNKQNTNCFATTSFQIGVNKMPLAHQPKDLYLCDDESADGMEKFDLMAQASDVLGSQTASDFNITYHLSQNEADSGQNAITNSSGFPNSTNPQTIYVRVENKQATCFSSTSFQLNVKPRPVLAMNDAYSICEGKSIKIVAPVGFSSYKWSNGATANSIMVATAGNYSLTVTKDYGVISCETTENIVVSNSNIATITKVDIQDWTDNNNSIFVQANGDGDYEYSIDGLNYQDSPMFTDLASGSHTVYVNDKKGCGLATEEVYLLIYPKFFTPNGDGYNDAWKIKFSFFEPEMKVAIFDRYGKLLKQLNHANGSWDGKYNEHDVPSDDYWFLVTRADGKEYKGHFSLIR